MSTNPQPEQIILAALPWRPVLTFDVIGTPQQRGSKTPWLPKHKDGSPVMRNGRQVIATMDSNKKSKSWMQCVSNAAHEAWGRELITEPVALSITFFFSRPQSHFRTGKNKHLLRDSAPADCLTRKDLTKLIRSTEDALKGCVIKDDLQVCEYLSPMRREYTTGAEKATITIYRRMSDSPVSLF